MSDELAEAGRRKASDFYYSNTARATIDELTRLRAVEKAAAAYVYTDAGDPQIADRYEELEALIRAGEGT